MNLNKGRDRISHHEWAIIMAVWNGHGIRASVGGKPVLVRP